MAGCAAIDLVPKPADEDVDGSVAVRLAPPPEALEQLVTRNHAAALERERVEQAELGRGQLSVLPSHVRLDVVRVDQQLLDLDRLSTRDLRDANSAPGGSADPRDELLHGERLDEVVVGADLECMDAVVLGPT